MAEWPDQFVYVCNATQAAVVNALPVVHAGIERIVTAVILCGADKNSDDAATQREAILPALQFEDCIKRWAPHIPTIIHYGDPERFDLWSTTMRQIIGKAEEFRVPVVYNFTGGRKTMSQGASFALGEHTRHVRVWVKGNPLCTDLVTISDGNITQEEAPRQGELTLAQVLALYGLEHVNDTNQREKMEAFYHEHEQKIEQFTHSLINAGRQGPVQLRSLLDPLVDERGKLMRPEGRVPLRVNGDPHNWRNRARRRIFEALRRLDGFPGIGLHPREDGACDLSVANQGVVNFLRGGWLEAAIYNQIRNTFLDRNDVTVAANVELRNLRPEATTGYDVVGEIDIAVLIRSQLHIVEVKTGTLARRAYKTGEQSLTQVEALKRRLQGPFGRTFIVNPFQTVNSHEIVEADFAGRTRQAGVELLLGRNAREDLTARLHELAETK